MMTNKMLPVISEEKYVRVSLDLTEEEAEMLRDFALTKITKDRDALIEYALNWVIKDFFNLGEEEKYNGS